MYNLILDPLPTDYQGYLIRTDYRIGIQISQVLEDSDYTPYERLTIAYDLLYGEGVPPDDIAINGLQWFLNSPIYEDASEGCQEPTSAGKTVDYFSFDFDASRIYTGFRRAYGIELDKIDMHWFEFLALLSDLGECAFTRVIDFRSADLSKMDKETKRVYQKMRRKFALPQPISQEEQEFVGLLENTQPDEREIGE